MSEADKIFEEIGYKKYEHNIFKEGEEPKFNEWITQDAPFIEYRDEKEINGIYYSMFIMFMIDAKRVQIGGYEKGTTPYGKHYEIVRNSILNTKEVKAISLKVGELGWK
jgi:hypothetical protein|nr:MAG TPA: hypothetical protein [Caudoviricetes sp.]